MRQLNEQSIEDIALGAALLGTGGGGDPYIGKLMALQAIKKYGPIDIISIDEVPDDALIVPSAMMGAPTVLIEKIPNGSEFKRAFEVIEKFLSKGKIFATVPIEAGGVNSMVPLLVAAQMRIPIVDCDGMGRAFPELQMVTYHLEGITATPMVITDEKGNVGLLDTISNNWAENIARAMTVSMGGAVMINIYHMTGKQLKKSSIRDIMTYSERIGRTIREISQIEGSSIKKLLEVCNGYELFRGKIVDVLRETKRGFNFGTAKIDGIENCKGEKLEINFQNENLIAKKGNKILATVPDLICNVDLESMLPITTEALKYGRRIITIGIPCDTKWRTSKGIETVGPRYFGYDIDYIPVEERVKGVE